MIARDVAEFLSRRRFRMGTEAILQDDVEAQFRAVGIRYEREKRLAPGERVDFFVDGAVAVELKIRAQRKSIYRQLERYAKHEQVTGLVLVTASAVGMPATIEGKPIYVVHLGLSAL